MRRPSARREETAEQIKALHRLKTYGGSYGYDISQPAKDTKEAIQWLYFAYLAAVKEQNGAAMSLAAPPPSWTSTPSGTWKTAFIPRNRFRNL